MDECGTEVIECSQCGEVLNGKSLWIVEDKLVCEKCYVSDNTEVKK